MKIYRFKYSILSFLTKYSLPFLCLIFLLNPTNSYSTKIDFSGTAITGVSLGNEKYILYSKDGIESRFYTNYLPPKGSFNNNEETEHPLEKCGLFNQQTINMIGLDCMIAIPPPCPSLIADDNRCLTYANVFEDVSSKKLRPKSCSQGEDKINCLSTDKPYCHLIDDPMLGWNCKLASCNLIPNHVFRRPGVNCMADCNQSPGNSIYNAAYYMEGFNCLHSCSTTANPIPGHNCVFEFNNYVMPLCSIPRIPDGHALRSFNLSIKSPNQTREDCIDLKDLPLCVAGESDSSKKCVNRCITNDDVNYDLSCVRPSDVNNFCHYNSNNPNCKKYYCKSLSPKELKFSNNAIPPGQNESNQVGCITSDYLDFSYYQLNSENHNNYKTNYTLARIPCQSPDYLDTETIVKVLGSQYYESSLSGNYPYLQKIIDNVIQEGGQDTQQIRELHTPTHNSFAQSTIFDRSSFCKFNNVSQKISCDDYKKNKLAPNDCNSNGFAPSDGTTCTTSNCFCNVAAQLYCYKTGINCNKSTNQIYPVCKTLNTAASIPETDTSASWFFKPALDPLAIKEINGVRKLMPFDNFNNYHPLKEDISSIANKSDNIEMSTSTLTNNFNNIIGIIWASTSPGIESANLGQAPISPEYMCGMNNNINATPSEDSLYYKTDVHSYYGLDEKIIHKFEVCARFMSTGAILNESCGRRKCRANCSALGSPFQICTKNCGVDICKEIQVITDESGAMTEDCISDEKSFTEKYPFGPKENCRYKNPTYCLEKKFPKCAVKLSNNGDALENARIRSYIPDPSSNFICSVLEFQGTTTRHLGNNYFDGDEFFLVPSGQYKNFTENVAGIQTIKTKTLFKKICVSGTYDSSTGFCTNGFNTNSDDINTNVWRTSRIVRYILQPPNSSGGWDMGVSRDGTTGNLFYLNNDGADYIDQFGSPNELTYSRDPLKPNMSIHRIDFNKKIKYETSDCIKFPLRYSSPIYNNVETRKTAPSLFIPNLLIDGICDTSGGGAGTIVCDASLDTDFYTPGIKVVWGNKSAAFPLQNDPASITNYKIIKINADSEQGVDYQIHLRNTGLTDYTGMVKTVFLKKSFDIEKNPNVCLYEKEGSGSSVSESLIGCVPRRRAASAVITSMIPTKAPSETLYNQTSFQVKFNNPSYSGLAYKTIEIPKLTDLLDITQLKKCLGNISNQGYPICIERHECTILNFECIENERDLLAELSKNPRSEIQIVNMRKVSKYCNEILLPKCNALKGLGFTTVNSRLNTDILTGFNAPANGDYYGWHNEVCIVSGVDRLDDPVSKKYVVENIPTDPSFSGKCSEYPTCTLYNFSDSQSLSLAENQRIRLATPRELNLCFEYTKFLQSCPPITYITSPNPNKSDPYFILELDSPDISHTLRYSGQQIGDSKFNAELDIAFIGNIIEGKCVGFYQQNGNIVPTAQCTETGWDNFQNNCIQYTCPVLPVSSNGANDLGEYTNTYDPPKNFKSLIGRVHGYASWDQKNIEGTSKADGTFLACNVGFKKENSTSVYIPMNSRDGTTQLISYTNSLTSSQPDLETKHKIMSIFRKISPTSYSNGIIPTRKCNQMGVWEQVNNPCQRIKCPAINFENPADAGAYNLDDFGIIYDNDPTNNNLTLRTSESSVNSPTQKISFTAKANYLGKNKIEVIFTLLQTRYLLYLENGTQNFVNLEKGKSYAFKFEDGKYKKLDTSKDSYLKELWAKAGGATFPEGNARRSKNYLYTPNSLDEDDKYLIYGTCNSDLGYLSLGTNPSMMCDHLGNWTNLTNQCVSDCSSVSGTIGNDRGHGFATWAKSSPKIGESIISTATSCIGINSIAYPYQPLNDNEGTKKDYGIGNTDIGITIDNFDNIIETDNGADFTVSASTPIQAPSDDNQQGKEFAFKIQQNFASTSSFVSSNSNDNLISLFNTNTLTLNAPNNSIWSKITFASFGTPDYSNSENLRTDSNNNCDFLYSKLVLALKCIGNTTCNISLSDFINYDSYMPETCQQNLGNGLNGSDSSTSDIGGTGGGGGGNSSAQGGSVSTISSGGVNTSSLSPSQNGKSYCDQNLHLTICDVSIGANAGKKVDITENDTGLFDGQSGSAIVKVAPADNTPDANKTIYNYSSPGVYTITIPNLSSVIGKTDIYFYVDYDITGGGGGGGGEGIAQGTDGNSGSRVRGKFRIEAGKSFKVHVGGGGKAGKTGCFGSSPSSSGVVSEVEDKYLPNKILISVKTQNLTKKINSKLLAKKQKKSYQNIFATNNIKKPTKYHNKNNDKIYDIILAKNSNRQIFDDRINYKKANFSENYQGTKNSIKSILSSLSNIIINNSYAGNIIVDAALTDECPENSYFNNICQFYFIESGSTVKEYFSGPTCPSRCGYNEDGSYYCFFAYCYCDETTFIIDGNRCIEPRNCNLGSFSDTYTVDANFGFTILPTNSTTLTGRSATTTISCSGTGYASSNATLTCYDGNLSLTTPCSCASGYNSIGNKCIKNCPLRDYSTTYTVDANFGFTILSTNSTTLTGNSATTTISCSGTGYATSNATLTCNNGNLNLTTPCSCASGYNSIENKCVAPNCSINPTSGYRGSTSIPSNSSNTSVNCNGTNFNTSNTLTYSPCTAGGTLSYISGTCSCATNYFLKINAISANNTCIPECNVSENDISKWGLTPTSTSPYTILKLGAISSTISCNSSRGYSGNATLICDIPSGESTTTYSLTTNCNCAAGYNHGNTSDTSHTVPSTGAWQKTNSCFKTCSVSASESAGYGTGSTAYTTLEGTNSKTCSGTGYSTTDDATISCSSSGVASVTNPCDCLTNYTKSNVSNHTPPSNTSSLTYTTGANGSCYRKCSVSASESAGYGTGSTAYTTLEGTNSKTCSGTGYSTTDDATISCSSSGVASVTNPCDCLTNYTKSNGSNHTPPSNTSSLTYTTGANGSCYRKCNITAGNARGWGVGISAFDVLQGTNNINCSGTRYATPTPANTLSVSCDSSGNASISAGCTCASGYAKSASGGSHTKPADVTTAGSEINYYYSTSGQYNSGTCFKECTVSAAQSNNWGTGTSAYTVLEGANTKACTSNGFISSTNITISCDTNGNATAATCQKIGCPTSFNLEGIANPLTNKSGQNTQSCDANGYHGNIIYYCSTNSSTASYTVTTPCSEYACTGTQSVPGIGSVSGGTGANELNCLSSLGFSGIYKYYCNALGIHIKVQECNANVCNLSPDSESGTHGIGFLARTGLSSSGTIDCDANGWSGTKYYTCTSNSTIETTPKCYKNVCIDFTNPGVTETITGKSGVSSNSCTKPGYSGTLQFFCKDDGIAEITTECIENTCNVLSGIGYSGKNNQKISGSYACDEGYYGTVNWVCNAGNANATVTHNCTRITCNPPASANASLSTLDYTGGTWTNYSCQTGFKANFDIPTNSYLTPQYKCETDSDGANPSSISIRNACVEVTCNIPGYGIIGYNGGNRHTINCNPNNGLMGTAILVCDEYGTVSFIQTCNIITCNLPTCSSESCPANVQNTLEDGSRMNFNNFFTDLNCKASHYFDNCPEGISENCGRPKVRCKYDPTLTTTPSAGVAEFMGTPCQQTTCIANNDLNSVIDSTAVNWTGDTYVSTSCKNGYYMQNSTLPPKYNCTGSGSSANYNYLNPCLEITCTAPENSFGIDSNALLSWGSEIQVPCNKTGYTGNFTYNCTGSTDPGTITITDNSCIVRSCNLTSNNSATFATYVANGQNLGGVGGKILSSSVYFKGGDGGKSSNTLTTGAGGGGGSASFIENSDGRIIVIAGGGGGGSGGGSSPINSPEPNLSPIADSKLFTNIFGSYLIAKMQTLPIQNSDTSKTGGLVYGLSDASNSFNLNAPAGMFISDIFFSSLGNPITTPRNPLNPNSIPTPFSVKYNTCHSPNSLRLAEINCQGRDSCSQLDINDLEFNTICTPDISSKSWSVVAGYSYKEPSITIDGITKLVKEINLSTMTFGPAILENNKVYNFIDFGSFWIKYVYWDDEFIIKTSTPINPADIPPLKLKFHRSNNTLEPKLKLTQISDSSSSDITSFYKIKKIVNETPSPISIGYIKENIFYILRLNTSAPGEAFWEIREYTDRNAEVSINPELPKRTCMTSQLSENGMLGTVWSPTNSVCINKCPGYDPLTKIGDDRIGAGATLHFTSNLGGGGIVYWPETAFGQKVIKIFSTSNSAETGLSNKGYRVFNTYNDSTSAKQFEKEVNQVGAGVFILERECGANGVWRDPKPLCSTGGGSPTDATSGNFNDTRIYLDHSSNPDSIYNNYNRIGGPKYIRADTDDQAVGECLNGYKRITTAEHGIFQKSSPNQYQEKLTFACKSHSVNGKRYEDLTYLDKKSGEDCIKYCKMEDLSVSSGIEKKGPLIDESNYSYNNETLLLPGKSINLDCKSSHTYARTYIRPNYLYNEINRINKIYNINWDRCQFDYTNNGELRMNLLTSDIAIADIEEKHINCMDELIFARYWGGNLNYDIISPQSMAYVNINSINYERTLEFYYYLNSQVHKNVRQYFDEDVILIARKKTNKTMVTENPVKPRFECISGGNKDTAIWSSVSEPTNCRVADRCLISKYHGIRYGATSTSKSKIARFSSFNTNPNAIDADWFALRSYLYSSEVTSFGDDVYMNHNQSIAIGTDTQCQHNQYGRCGYTVHWRRAWYVCANQFNAMWDMKRKFLKSASCNDGHLTVEWDFDDPNPGNACNGDGGYGGSGCGYVNDYEEEKKPEGKFLGYSSDINFSSITDTFSKIRNTQELACPTIAPAEDYSPPISGMGNF